MMPSERLTRWLKWLTPGIRVKRWLAVLALGILVAAVGAAEAMLKLVMALDLNAHLQAMEWPLIMGVLVGGGILIAVALVSLSRNLLAPYRRHQPTDIVDVMMAHSRRDKGIRFVAIGGGTGLPASLRGMKEHTHNITAIVTVADDGGSSGRLRREMGVAPPGDLRNNIAALADDDSLMTRLFQYRFRSGDLQGHAFGNLFIAALANIVAEEHGQRNSLAEALIEVERVLNIRGRVLPATLDDVTLVAQVKLNAGGTIRIRGEAQIGDVEGKIDGIEISPPTAEAYPESVRAIQEADLIVIGPGSLYTSILPNLMVKGIADALRATPAYKIYVCNVATQPVETPAYTVAEHVMALEQHIGRGVFQAVLANDAYPLQNAGEKTYYVSPAPAHHEILQRYEVRYTGLVDSERPWRHDPFKLATAIMALAYPKQG